jgi:signal transduction histidine kinase
MNGSLSNSLRGILSWEANRCRYDLEREPSVKTRAILHRIAREAITNAREHSKATLVSIALEERNGGFFVKVDDDGAGFDVASTNGSSPNHLGLTSMRERAELAGGWLKLESELGLGTNVEFWLPDDGGG